MVLAELLRIWRSGDGIIIVVDRALLPFHALVGREEQLLCQEKVLRGSRSAIDEE